MREVEEIFSKNGFHPGSIIPDGKIHRFKGENDSGTSLWYVVNESKTANGDSFYFGAIGDWRARDRDVKFSTLTSARYEDKETLEKSFKKVERQVENSQKEIWEETARITWDFWQKLPTEGGVCEHPYLMRKQINSYFGCKTQIHERGRELLVPLRDVRDKFWGYQKINPEGQKFFFPGTRKLGNFHLIGSWGPKVLICEGFATGASLHMATELPVAVAFDTSNLLEVATQIKRHLPESSIIVCGDDDVFTPEEKGGNVGRKKAEEVAKAVLGQAVFPKFESLDQKPTDFNDLHCLEGLDAVKKQIDPTEGIQVFIKPLGTRAGSKFMYTSSHNKNICVLDSHSESELLKLLPLIEYWRMRYPTSKNGVDWQLARASLMEECLQAGVFQEEKIRGSGVWLDEGRIVLHLGDRLIVNGSVADIAFFKSQYHYELDVGFSNIHKKPLSVEECASLRYVVGMFNYTNVHQMLFLGGWIALASICGALPWRPHLWLTGEAGSGKTTIKDFIDQILDWGFKRVSVTGGTTEAGIRQRLRASALPVIFDEFEPEGKKNIERVLDTLDLMRQASSLQKGEIIKGTQDQRGAAYQVSFMALVSSIKTSLLTEADRSRFTVVELESGKSTLEQWKEIQAAMNRIDEEFAERLVARMVKMIPIVVQNAKIAQDAFVTLGFSQRIGQQYGTLVAGWQALVSDSLWTLEQAIQFCSHIDLGLESTVSTQKNPDDCLEWLMGYTVRFEALEYSMRRLFTEKKTGLNDTLEKVREKFGISIRRDGAVFFVRSNPHLSEIFTQKSKWHHAWFETLARLPGAKKDSFRVNGRSYYGLLLPSEFFHVKHSEFPND